MFTYDSNSIEIALDNTPYIRAGRRYKGVIESIEEFHHHLYGAQMKITVTVQNGCTLRNYILFYRDVEQDLKRIDRLIDLFDLDDEEWLYGLEGKAVEVVLYKAQSGSLYVKSIKPRDD